MHRSLFLKLFLAFIFIIVFPWNRAAASEIPVTVYFDSTVQLCVDTTKIDERIPDSIPEQERYISLIECRKTHPELLLQRAAGIFLWPMHLLIFSIFSFIVLKKKPVQMRWNIFFLLITLCSVWIFFSYSSSIFFSNSSFDDFFIKRYEALRSLILVTAFLSIVSIGTILKHRLSNIHDTVS